LWARVSCAESKNSAIDDRGMRAGIARLAVVDLAEIRPVLKEASGKRIPPIVRRENNVRRRVRILRSRNSLMTEIIDPTAQ
jgi:hypothetical protein